MNMKAVRSILRSRVNQYPGLYFPMLHVIRSPRRYLHVRRDTEIVIEGYPRSANTFAVAAFLLAQRRPVRIARHLHAPAQVIQGVRWGIPVLVLIRRPEDAVLSLLVREPHLSAKQALMEYIWFYEKIRPYSSSFVLATFDEVTKDFGLVIQRVNARFGTDFSIFVHTEENVKKVYQLIEKMDQKDTGRTMVTETTVARPSEYRKRIKKERSKELYHPSLAILLKHAREVYQQTVGH